ncbi:MAG TPA: hypothetical protein VLV83_09745 [Acidobacteriota bacterium]|nr:hypothetical protein [Acidobacteriota bacterium]
MRSLIVAVLLFATSVPVPGGQREHLPAHELAELLSDKKLCQEDPEKFHELIRQAEFRRIGDPRVISALVDLLEYRWIFSWESLLGGTNRIRPITRMDRFPACGALAAIGKPALDQLTQVLVSGPSDSTRFANSVAALQHIFRDVPSEGVEYLQEAIESSNSPGGKENLEAALTCFNEQKLMFDVEGKYQGTCVSGRD